MLSSGDIQNFRQNLQNRDFLLAVSAGLVEGVSLQTKFGYRDALSTTGVIWAGPSNDYIFPVSGGQSIEVVSDNVGDTGDIEIVGNIVSSDSEIKVTVTLNGLTPVAVPNTDWIATNRAYNDTDTDYLGNISIRGTGTPNSNVFAYIPVGDGQTQQLPYMLPANRVGLLVATKTWLNRTQGQTASCISKFFVKKENKVFRNRFRFGLQRDGNSENEVILPLSRPIPPSAQIKIESTPSVELDLSGIYQLVLIDTDLIEPDYLQQIIAS